MEHAIDQGIHYQFPESQNTERPDLFWMISNGLMTEVYTALESVMPTDIELFVGETDENGRTCLFYAGFLDLASIGVYLLSQGADLFAEDHMG
jgi:hypothetical protein